MTTIQVRIEKKTKEAAVNTLEALGLDLSSAVKLFLHQVVVEQAIPFKPSRNKVEIKAKWDKSTDAALKTNGYKNTSELFEKLNIQVNVQDKSR
jgi:DNA-damage-inducible protein J